MSAEHPAQRDRFGLALAVPPLAWASQGLFGWFVAGHVCRAPGAPAACFAPGVARLLVAAVTGLALGTTLATFVAARGRARRPVRAGSLADERRRFVACAALASAAALGVGLLWAGLPLLLLPFCGGAPR